MKDQLLSLMMADFYEQGFTSSLYPIGTTRAGNVWRYDKKLETFAPAESNALNIVEIERVCYLYQVTGATVIAYTIRRYVGSLQSEMVI